MPRTGSKDNKLAKRNIAVLAGGPSNEREISLLSGGAVHKALKKAGLNSRLLDISERLEKDIKKFKIDLVFIALHGRFGEDGTVQAILEKMKVPYTGSDPSSSKLALDKIASRVEFEKAGIPVAAYRIFEKNKDKKINLDFPVVIKPQFEGSSIGLSIVDEPGGLGDALKEAFKYGEKSVAEKFIKGREITVGILDDMPLSPIEIVPDKRYYDFYAKYESPGTKYLVPAPIKRSLSKEAERLALLAHRSLGLRSFSRVDMMLGEDEKFYCLEVNSIPGLTERSLLPKAARARGISFQQLCITILKAAINN